MTPGLHEPATHHAQNITCLIKDIRIYKKSSSNNIPPTMSSDTKKYNSRQIKKQSSLTLPYKMTGFKTSTSVFQTNASIRICICICSTLPSLFVPRHYRWRLAWANVKFIMVHESRAAALHYTTQGNSEIQKSKSKFGNSRKARRATRIRKWQRIDKWWTY